VLWSLGTPGRMAWLLFTLCAASRPRLPFPLAQTYLNAMTYPDRTVYPVASPNLTDFYNLVGVSSMLLTYKEGLPG
jgi:hypothetical protein